VEYSAFAGDDNFIEAGEYLGNGENKVERKYGRQLKQGNIIDCNYY